MPDAYAISWPADSEFAQRLLRGEEPPVWQAVPDMLPDLGWIVDDLILDVQWASPEGSDAPWSGGIVIAYYMPTDISNADGAVMHQFWSLIGLIPEGAYTDTKQALAALEIPENYKAPPPRPDVSRWEILLDE